MSEAQASVPARRRGIHHRLYHWVLDWTGHRHAQTALFVLSFTEASCFPVPPDLLLMAMTLSKPGRARSCG